MFGFKSDRKHHEQWSQNGVLTHNPIDRLESQLASPDAKALGEHASYSHLKEVIKNDDKVIDLEFEKGVAAGMLLEHVTVRITCADAKDRAILLEDISKQGGPRFDRCGFMPQSFVSFFMFIFDFPHIWMFGHAETVPRHISRFQF